MIRTQFDIEFGPVERWVSMEFATKDESIEITTLDAAKAMTDEPGKFRLNLLEKLKLTGDKIEVPSEFRSAVGKLNYLAGFNPCLRFYVSFLSESAHYDPTNSLDIVEKLIQHSAWRPYVLRFPAIVPRFLAIYSDANHSLKSLRGHWGCLLQLQMSDEYEDQGNVVHWTSGRLAKLYDSVYIAELKAARNSLVTFLEVRNDVFRSFPGVQVVMFCDNKSMVDKINSDDEVHPFASDYADFCRQTAREYHVTVKWCPSRANLADKLTKATKW